MTDWSELPLTAQHAGYLRERAAISASMAQAAGIRSATTVAELPEWARGWGRDVLPALVFPYRSPGATVVEQVRPDEPLYVQGEGKPRKYLLPEGCGSFLNAARPQPDADTLLLVEGTKQTFAAASWAGDDVAVYGIAGCRNWSMDGVPIKDLRAVKGKAVVVALDADVEHNRDVYEAAQRLEKALRAEQPKSVLFLLLPGGSTTGLDDLLAEREDDEHRRDYLAGLIAGATKLPARKPAAKKDIRPPAQGDEFFEREQGLLVHRLSTAVREKLPAALTAERKVALYRNGYYNIDGVAFSGAVGMLLGDRFRPAHRAAAEEYTAGLLYNAGLELPTYVTTPLLNVANGMLHLPTEALKPHDAVYMSAQQIPVAWDPEAKCPTYERWLEICGVGDQVDDLEETVSMMLDPSRTPHKALFLFGPSRSGKSTFLRLMQAMVGERNMSAVTLHQLAENRFAAANVFGKVLNSAADLSAAHVEDLSIFKMMTGEDPIQADRKFGSQFAFTNKALFAFSGNHPPTVGEGSRAYIARIKPFKFPISFEGRENPEMEDEMIANELPGILVRWVRAWQRRTARGTYLPTRPDVAEEFETRSDRVRQFVAERCLVQTTTEDGRPITHGATVDETRASTKVELVQAFNVWAEDNHTAKMGRGKIVDRIMQLPRVVEVRRGRTKTRAVNITVRSEFDGAWEVDEPTPEAGGSFEAPVAVSGGKTATETATADLGERRAVAEVAVSSPIVAHSERRRPPLLTESEGVQGVGRGVVLDMAHSAPETATSATEPSRTLPTNLATTPSQATQLDLLGSYPTSPNGRPEPRPHRTTRPGDATIPLPPAQSGRPAAGLVASLAPAAMSCPHCHGPKEPVPPTLFWYACRPCFPATFEGA